jgi:hypothetical protein
MRANKKPRHVGHNSDRGSSRPPSGRPGGRRAGLAGAANVLTVSMFQKEEARLGLRTHASSVLQAIWYMALSLPRCQALGKGRRQNFGTMAGVCFSGQGPSLQPSMKKPGRDAVTPGFPGVA